MGEKEYQNLADEPASCHFDFWLNPVEAESLYGCLQHEITKCHATLVRIGAGGVPEGFPPGKPEDYIAWFEGRIDFLTRLMEKVRYKEEKR